MLGRVDRDPSVADGVAGGLGQRRDLDEPLQRQPRLDDGVAARAVTDGVKVRPLLRDDAALLSQRRDDGWARLEPVETEERAVGGDVAALVEDDERRQAVPAADLEVVRVVRGRDLDRAGAELGIDVVVGDDRDAATGERQLDLGADEVLRNARRRDAPRRRCRRASSRHGWSRRRCCSSGRRCCRTGSRRARPRPRCARPRCRTAPSGSAGTS